VHRAAIAVAILVATALLSFRTVYEPDLGWHLAHGREDAAGRLVRTNVFSFVAPDYRQHYTSWLSETVAYAAWLIGRDVGVQVAMALAIAATLALVYGACRYRAGVLPSVAILIVACMVLEPRAIPRPHVASFLGMAAMSWLIQRASAAGSIRPLLWAPLLIALWSNAHIECIFGILLLAIFAAGEWAVPSVLTRGEAARAIGIAAACAAAALANPYGVGLYRYVYENASVPQLLAIAELRPAYWAQYRAFFVFVFIACFVAALATIAPIKRFAVWEVASTIAFAWLGWRYLRLTPLVVFVAAPLVAERLTIAATRWRLDARAVVVTAAALAVFMARAPMATFVTGFRAGDLHPAAMFSSRAIDFVQDEGLTGPLFNSNNLGGWLAWKLYPRVRTFQDSRLQAYPPEHFRRILDASRSQPAWDALVAEVDWAMLSIARPNALSGAGRFPSSGWATVFWDGAIEIVVRRGGRYAPLASAREYRVLRPDTELFDLAPQLASTNADQLRAEAARNRRDNPDGFAAAAVLCVFQDQTACATAERVGTTDPTLDDDLALLHVLRSKR
jgi:hypothetical protein